MSKDVLVKNVSTKFGIGSNQPQIFVGGGPKQTAPGALPHKKTLRERTGGALGAAAGTGLALTGKHRSFADFVNSLVSGYSTFKPLGEAAGRKFVTPQQQMDANRGLANREAERRLAAGKRVGVTDAKTGDYTSPTQLSATGLASQARRAIVGSPDESIADRAKVGFARTPAEEVAVTPAEEVAVTPASHQLAGKPSEVAVTPASHQLAGKPSEVAVEPLALPAPKRDVQVLEPGVGFTEQPFDDPRDTSKIAVNPERGVSTEVPGSLGDFAIPKDKRVRVERPAPTASNRESMFGGQTYVKHPSRTELPAYDKRETPLSVPEEEEEEHMKRYYETADLQGTNVEQVESDAALRANAAAATQKVMMTPPPVPLQTVPTAAAGLSAKENMALNDPQNYDSVPEHAQDGGPTPAEDPKVAVQAAFKQGLAGSPATTGTPGNPGMLAVPPDLRNRIAGAAEGFDEVGTSIDRLPVVGIRKARRGILVV